MTKSFFESTGFQAMLSVVVIATFLMSIFSLISIYQVKKFIIPTPLDVKNFLEKLNTHEEMKGYETVNPLNIIQITPQNLQGLQSQVKDLDVSHLGSFIVQYEGQLVLFDYINDTIKGVINLKPQLPADFFTKLNKHIEMKALKDQQPLNGGLIDEQILSSLKQQSSDFKNAKVGDYFLVYQDTIIVFDYAKDKIVASSKNTNQ